MDIKEKANELSRKLNPFGNVVVTTHFYERLLERKLDFNSDAIKKWAEFNNDNLCTIFFTTELNGATMRSNRKTFGGVTFVYVVDVDNKKLFWKTCYE